MTEPIVSVIVPSYKPDSYLKDCLKSLSDQSFANENYEVIIVLNGIREPYYSYIQDVIDGFYNSGVFKLLYSNKKGVSNARNLGVESSNGEFVCFVDDDDTVVNDYLRVLYETIVEDERGQSSLAISNVKTVKGETFGIDYLGKSFEKCNSTYKGNNILRYRSFFSVVWGKMIPKSVINGIVFDQKLYIGEDSLFMFELSKNIRSIKLTPENIAYVRHLRQDSVLRTKRAFKEEVNIILALSWRYTKVYLSSPMRYNFLFFVSRQIAVLKRFVKIITAL